jgi:hypothetical protein
MQDQSDVEGDVYLEGLNVDPVTLREFEEIVRWAWSIPTYILLPTSKASLRVPHPQIPSRPY